MIQIVPQSTKKNHVSLYWEKDERLNDLSQAARKLFDGSYLVTLWREHSQDGVELLLGLGKREDDPIRRKEIFAKVVKECREKNIRDFSIDITPVLEAGEISWISDIVEGTLLGTYAQKQFKDGSEGEYQIEFCGILAGQLDSVSRVAQQEEAVAAGILFARDMVNMPGNKLRPRDFADQIIDFVGAVGVTTRLIEAKELKAMGMAALLGVGESSEYPPCLLVMRYLGDSGSQRITGLVGKGVTCDTGGYCLKPADSMLGIKGDMAGAAAVSGALYGLAANQVRTNVVAVIPMCENRISSGSLLPGDVIGSYAGKTIEIANTDAEGRLILADAVSYAVREEKVTEILDIATLTGAVVNMLGFSVAGALCDDDDLYERFKLACQRSGERYWRLPFYQEHEKMIESNIADVRNLGEKHCGTITAGLFIRAFAEERPWLHLDIAGTAWVDKPVFEFQTVGATGAGVTSIYQLCSGE